MTNPTIIFFDDDLVTSAMTADIGAAYFGLSYTPATVDWRGNPALQAGDVVRVKDRYGAYHNILVTEHTMTFRGGMDDTITCSGVSGINADYYK